MGRLREETDQAEQEAGRARLVPGSNPSATRARARAEVEKKLQRAEELKALETYFGEGFEGENEEVRTYLLELIEMANGTGQRLGAIVRLRWSDWFPDRSRYGVLQWRGEHDKNNQTRRVLVMNRVRKALLAHRDRLSDILPEDSFMWSAPDSDGHLGINVAISWLQEAERDARGHHVKHFGFHAFRRRWATKNKNLPRKTAAYMGGWKGPHTMERVYQQVTADDMERALFRDEDDADAAGSEAV